MFCLSKLTLHQSYMKLILIKWSSESINPQYGCNNLFSNLIRCLNVDNWYNSPIQTSLPLYEKRISNSLRRRFCLSDLMQPATSVTLFFPAFVLYMLSQEFYSHQTLIYDQTHYKRENFITFFLSHFLQNLQQTWRVL